MAAMIAPAAPSIARAAGLARVTEPTGGLHRGKPGEHPRVAPRSCSAAARIYSASVRTISRSWLPVMSAPLKW